MPLILAAIRAFRKKIGEDGSNLFKAAPGTVEGTHVGTILSPCFVLPLTQSEERKDRHNDNNQSDQIDNIVHTSLPHALAQRGHI